MKKKITQPTMSSAPATKPVAAISVAKKKPATASRPKAATVKASAPLPSPVPVAPVAPAPVAAAAPAPVAAATPVPAVAQTAPVQPVEHSPVVTTITAQIDVGFGNTLYIRGEGAGLSWDAGVPMECIGNELWRIILGESARGFTFKFLINDVSWNLGPDYTVSSGSSETVTPQFQV